MRHLITLALLTTFLLTYIAPIFNVTAAYVGVATNDYFAYGQFDVWIDPPTAPLLPKQITFQNVTSINFTVTGISSWDVTLRQKIVFKNATTRTFDGGINLETGLGTGYLFFIPAGLGRRDMIYPQGTSQNFTWTINETRIDPRWGREICFYNSTRILPPKDGVILYTSEIIKWDRLTGVLLSVYDVQAAQGTGYIEGGLYYQLVATNRFFVSQSGPIEMTTLIIIVGAVLVGALVVAVVKTSTSSPKKKWKRIKE